MYRVDVSAPNQANAETSPKLHHGGELHPPQEGSAHAVGAETTEHQGRGDIGVAQSSRAYLAWPLFTSTLIEESSRFQIRSAAWHSVCVCRRYRCRRDAST